MFHMQGCREVGRLAREVGDLEQMMESMKRMIAGQRFEKERGKTGDHLTRLEETDEKEKCERVMTP